VVGLGGAEVPAVARRTVEEVVDPLGDGEELRVTAQHQPARVDPGAAAVGQQRRQHLRDATALPGGVDVPHHPAAQQRAGLLGDRGEPRGTLRRQQALEPGELHRLDVDLAHAPHRAPPARLPHPNLLPRLPECG
jgi:hypothetical protein